MRNVCLLFFLLVATRVSAYEHFASPNRLFEAYTTAHWPDGTGMKLFLRRTPARDEGSLLWENNRWIDAKWSPDSRFLAVLDHLDGHITDIYVFGVSTANAAAPPITTLLYHTPDPVTYDVQWDVVDWRSDKREIILKKEVHDQSAGTKKTTTMTAKIGTEPLKIDQPKRPNPYVGGQERRADSGLF